MKKELIATSVLILGISFKSYAGTGNASDGLLFALIISAILLTIVGLMSGIDYLKKNGRTIIIKSRKFILKNVRALTDYLNKALSDDFHMNTQP